MERVGLCGTGGALWVWNGASYAVPQSFGKRHLSQVTQQNIHALSCLVAIYALCSCHIHAFPESLSHCSTLQHHLCSIVCAVGACIAALPHTKQVLECKVSHRPSCCERADGHTWEEAPHVHTTKFDIGKRASNRAGTAVVLMRGSLMS